MSENKKKFTYFYLTTYGRSLPEEQQGLDVGFTTYARSLLKEQLTLNARQWNAYIPIGRLTGEVCRMKQ